MLCRVVAHGAHDGRSALRVRRWLAVGVGVAVLAGCSAQGHEPSTATAASTSTPEPAPSPTERTTTDLSDPELGVVFDDIPALTGPAASAHDAVALYQVEQWRTLTTGRVSPALAPLVSPELLRKAEYGVQRNTEAGWLFDGTLHISVADVAVDGTTATASVCRDHVEVLFLNTDGSAPKTYEEIEFPRYERLAVRLSTADGGVTWVPEDATLEGDSC